VRYLFSEAVMKISEVIEILEKAKLTYGDIECEYEKYQKAWTSLVIKLATHHKKSIILFSDAVGLYAKNEPDIKIVTDDED